MKLVEYRIPLPYTTSEYQIGQLYAFAILSKEESGDGEGVEVIKNEPFEDENGKGQYTYKVYHVNKRLPTWLSKLIPNSSLAFHEEAWNAYPYCKTVVTSPFFGKKFRIELTTRHVPNDYGQLDNVHELSAEQLKKRKVVLVDIVNDTHEQCKKEEHPKNVNSPKLSSKLNRFSDGSSSAPFLALPLQGAEWYKAHQFKDSGQIMCCYKLVSVECKLAIIQSAIESKLHDTQRGLFLRLHQKMHFTVDDWLDLTMEEIRKLENEIKEELRLKFAEKLAKQQSKKGSKAAASSSTTQATSAGH